MATDRARFEHIRAAFYANGCLAYEHAAWALAEIERLTAEVEQLRAALDDPGPALVARVEQLLADLQHRLVPVPPPKASTPEASVALAKIEEPRQ